jgi:NADH:ubiquinone oxidoreductase subunit 5 (subunit L)/multisubunit Na+/H+ antiporter MnhA subunit
LVDTYYSRIRTTQAVSRSFTVGRLSDFTMLIALVEFIINFESDSLVTILLSIQAIIINYSTLTCYCFELTILYICMCCIIFSALCKCAQFILFV